METERFIGRSENRRPNEMWLRRRRSKRMDAIIQVGNLPIQKDIIPAPKNPVPLLEQDRIIMHQAADIKEISRKPRIVKPEGSPPKIA